MELNINSPAYYTKIHGVDDEIYSMCREISMYVKDKVYSDSINIVGIVPIIAHKDELAKGLWKETKKCDVKYGFASVSLQIDYDAYVAADIIQKKQLMISNILKSVKSIARKGKIDYPRFENDIKSFCERYQIELI